LNINKKWKKFLVTGCLHSTYACEPYKNNVREFKSRFQPDIHVEAGDVIDFTAIRSGAKGTKDEAVPLVTDLQGGLDWLKEMRPDVWLLGNHCVRPYELLSHPNSTLATLASYIVKDMQDTAKEIHAKIVPYDVEDGWYALNDETLVGHGYMYNMNALRDHVEMAGKNVIMSHLHHPHEHSGRSLKSPWGMCVGIGANPKLMNYARRRRNTLTWAHGFAWGEFTDTSTVAHLHKWKCANGEVEECRLPV